MSIKGSKKTDITEKILKLLTPQTPCHTLAYIKIRTAAACELWNLVSSNFSKTHKKQDPPNFPASNGSDWGGNWVKFLAKNILNELFILLKRRIYKRKSVEYTLNCAPLNSFWLNWWYLYWSGSQQQCSGASVYFQRVLFICSNKKNINFCSSQ